MHGLMYCVGIGLLMLVSAPAQQAITSENSENAQDHAAAFDSSRTAEDRVRESAIPLPQRTLPGTLVGVGLVGFVVVNCKRRK